jgi:hypothetical protein
VLVAAVALVNRLGPYAYPVRRYVAIDLAAEPAT